MTFFLEYEKASMAASDIDRQVKRQEKWNISDVIYLIYCFSLHEEIMRIGGSRMKSQQVT